jgi:hypothetical protein
MDPPILVVLVLFQPKASKQSIDSLHVGALFLTGTLNKGDFRHEFEYFPKV